MEYSNQDTVTGKCFAVDIFTFFRGVNTINIISFTFAVFESRQKSHMVMSKPGIRSKLLDSNIGTVNEILGTKLAVPTL